jgi:hypothetical protein
MFNKPTKGTEKRQLYDLIDKRNKQFSVAFRKLRDPHTILQAYIAINKVYNRHFSSIRHADRWLKLLMWVYDKEFRYFYLEELKDLFPDLQRHQHEILLRRMAQRHYINTDSTRRINVYTLTPEAHLVMQQFSKECLTEIMKIVKDGRKGKKHKKI